MRLTKIYPPLPTSVQPISKTKTLPIVPTKNERDPPLFTGKLLIKFQNILRNILFSVISSPIRMNCFRYLKLMSPLNAAICTTTYLERQKCYGPRQKLLFKKQLFDLEVKGQGPTKVIMVHGHTTLWSCTHIPNTIDISRKTKMLWPRQENTI